MGISDIVTALIVGAAWELLHSHRPTPWGVHKAANIVCARGQRYV